MTVPAHVFEIYIEARPEEIWRALTDPEMTRQYWFGALGVSDWTPGAEWRSESPVGELYLDGTILEAEPPHRLVQTFHIVHDAEAARDEPSRLTWEIAPVGRSTRLLLTHDQMGERTAVYTTSGGGWALILSGMKTLLETGRPMRVREPVETGAAG